MNLKQKILFTERMIIPAGAVIEIPDSLHDIEAVNLYKRITSDLHEKGILTYLDLPKIDIMCTSLQIEKKFTTLLSDASGSQKRSIKKIIRRNHQRYKKMLKLYDLK